MPLGLYKTEVTSRRGAWHPTEAVALGTLERVHWFNHQRLLTSIGLSPPAEPEEQYYRSPATPAMSAGVT